MTAYIHSFFEVFALKKFSESIFVSENDLVMNFAFYMKEQFPLGIFRFEVPYKVQFDPQKPTSAPLKFPLFSYIDLIMDLGEKKYAFEFKYQTALLAVKEIHEGLELKNHSAQDVFRFGFRKDIYRLEQLKKQCQIEQGYAILLSNDSTLINTDCRKAVNDRAYRFNNENLIKGGDANWSDIAHEPKWLMQKAFNISLPLRPEGYPFIWNEYLKYDDSKNGKFQFGLVEV